MCILAKLNPCHIYKSGCMTASNLPSGMNYHYCTWLASTIGLAIDLEATMTSRLPLIPFHGLQRKPALRKSSLYAGFEGFSCLIFLSIFYFNEGSSRLIVWNVQWLCYSKYKIVKRFMLESSSDPSAHSPPTLHCTVSSPSC